MPDSIRLQRHIEAPIDVVFEFLVEPTKLVRWLGVALDVEPIAGGLFRVDMNGNDVALGEYLEVDPPHLVRFTWGWEGSGEVPPGSSVVTIELSSSDAATDLVLEHAGLPVADDPGHTEGWNYFLDRFVVVGGGGEAGPARFPAEEPDRSS